jgi:hypothetical protein
MKCLSLKIVHRSPPLAPYPEQNKSSPQSHTTFIFMIRFNITSTAPSSDPFIPDFQSTNLRPRATFL